MASGNDERHALGRLILDYLKTFMWPAVVLFVVLFYQDDVLDILRNREVKFGGVFEIGQQVARIEKNAGEEIADLRALFQALQSADAGAGKTAIAADIETKLDNVGKNISREVDQIQRVQTLPAATPSAPANVAPEESTPVPERAVAEERRGFEALLDRDAAAAQAAFEAAARLWPDYHNVAEIARLLRDNAAALKRSDTTAWQTVYRTVLSDYSWGMPGDLRPAFRDRTADSYGATR
jgi:hypothetical protein